MISYRDAKCRAICDKCFKQGPVLNEAEIEDGLPGFSEDETGWIDDMGLRHPTHLCPECQAKTS